MTFIESLFATLQRGGLVMWPILLFSLYAVTLIVERWRYYRRQDLLLREQWARLDAQRDELTAAGLIQGLVSAGARLTGAVCTHRNLERSEQLEKVRNAFNDERADLEERLNVIAVIATLLPMLGLLGTVVGMIAAFDVIALHGTGNPNLMASGISQALITTEAGLLTSIPILYLHNTLTHRADRLVRRLDEYTTHLLHLCNQK
jgi:biopolymer transport protein ExbB